MDLAPGSCSALSVMIKVVYIKFDNPPKSEDSKEKIVGISVGQQLERKDYLYSYKAPLIILNWRKRLLMY